MQGKNKIIVGALVLALVATGAFVAVNSVKNVTTPSPAVPVIESGSPSAIVSQNVVTISESGFSPQVITVKAGETVTWMNSDSKVKDVSSAVHPTHQVYPPLNLGNIAVGESKSLTFPTAGTFKYHDHLYPIQTGSVVVQ